MLEARGWTACPPKCSETPQLACGRDCGPAGAGVFKEGGLLGFQPHPLSGGFATPTPVYFIAFWSLRIFIQKQGLKKLYRVSAAENWAPAPRPLPQLAAGRAPSLACPLTSPTSPFQSKGYQWKQQGPAGVERSLAPAAPQVSSLIPKGQQAWKP